MSKILASQRLTDDCDQISEVLIHTLKRPLKLISDCVIKKIPEVRDGVGVTHGAGQLLDVAPDPIHLTDRRQAGQIPVRPDIQLQVNTEQRSDPIPQELAVMLNTHQIVDIIPICRPEGFKLQSNHPLNGCGQTAAKVILYAADLRFNNGPVSGLHL